MTSHMSCGMCHMSCVTCHVSCVMYHMSHVMYHMSRVTRHMSRVTCYNFFSFFKALALCAAAFYKSICPSVCPSVCVSVCSLLRYHLKIFLPPLPEVGCPIFLEIRNPWRKVMKRHGLRFENFCFKVV